MTQYAVTQIAGLKSSANRAIAFLTCDSEADIDANAEFKKLTSKDEMTIRSRFDHWIDGGAYKQYFHGWDNEPNRSCFVFKLKENRFYGFLCHPKPKENPSFLVCVLVCHGIKTRYDTDPKKLTRCNQVRVMPAVIKATGLTFPERKKEGQNSWVN